MNYKRYPNVYPFCKPPAFLLLSHFARGMKSVLQTTPFKAHLKSETMSRRMTDCRGRREQVQGSTCPSPISQLVPSWWVTARRTSPVSKQVNPLCHSMLVHVVGTAILPSPQARIQAATLRKVQNQWYLTPGSDLCPLHVGSISWCRGTVQSCSGSEAGSVINSSSGYCYR